MFGPIDIDQVKRAHATFERENRQAIDWVLERAAAVARKHVEQKSRFVRRKAGKASLKSSMKHRITRPGGASKLTLSWPNPYAKFVEFGTRPHIISARPGRMLRFTVGGRVLFRKRVMHPGTKPYLFGRRAWIAAHRFVQSEMNQRKGRLKLRF